MLKKLLVIVALLPALWTVPTQAQDYPVVTIRDIQFISLDSLQNCQEQSYYCGDTVTVRGIVTVDGDQSRGRGADRVISQFWIQDGTGDLWTGLDVYGEDNVRTCDGDPYSPSPELTEDLRSVFRGDSVEITGFVTEFRGESEIVPIAITTIDSDLDVPAAVRVNVGDLNNNNQENQIVTGEPYEGLYVEIVDVTVVAANPAGRPSFVVEDGAGNRVRISDKFSVQRDPGSDFVLPVVGNTFEVIRGIVIHDQNGCTGGTGGGYDIAPFQLSDYEAGERTAPLLADVRRTPLTPTTQEAVVFSLTAEDVDGAVVSVVLNYAVGEENETYVPLAMISGTGTTYSATLPAIGTNGEIVKYYIVATDDQGNTADFPSGALTGSSNPKFFYVNDGGTTIYTVQRTPFSDGNSGYRDDTVTVRGVVTASATDLGRVFIQMPDSTEWAGIHVTAGQNVGDLTLGQTVEVTGVVEESFGFTLLDPTATISVLNNTGAVASVEVNPDSFSTRTMYAEQYESMVVTLRNPDADKGIYIVEQNADADPNDETRNFAEYRIGTDTLNPTEGTRVLVGRNSGSAFSSLNVSYINDSRWIEDAGALAVEPFVVQYGDTLDAMTGVMYYSFSNFKLLPRTNVDVQGYEGGVVSALGLRRAAIDLFPNPATGAVTLRGELPTGGALQIHDLTGRRMSAQTLSGAETQVDVQRFEPGVYLVSIADRDGRLIYTSKLVVR
ncbi:MAG: T9SS type A sorting domain-containing protein [Catalinimonas sp.]